MLQPKIKKELSEEPPLRAMSLERRGTIATLLASAPEDSEREEDESLVKKEVALKARSPNDQGRSQLPAAQVKQEPIDTVAVEPASATHPEITPRNFNFRGPRHTSGLLGTMNPFNFDGNDATDFSQGFGFNMPGSFDSMPDGLTQPETVTVTRFEYDNQQAQIRQLQSTVMMLEKKLLAHYSSDHTFVQDQIRELQVTVQRIEEKSITGLSSSSRTMQSGLGSLIARVTQLERLLSTGPYAGNGARIAIAAAANPVFDANAPDLALAPVSSATTTPTKGTKKRSFTNSANNEGSTTPGSSRHRKTLVLQIPSKTSVNNSAVGLPTPMLSAFQATSAPPFGGQSSFAVTAPSTPATPHTPYTPGVIGPPEAYKKTPTTIQKRKGHNLNKIVPPSDVLLPQVPLTDMEIIVYFFNSLTRPMVSLRLYARKWGPISISQALNEHRGVDPPYLRNTCSVKCTGAIKKGKKQYGDDWEVANKQILATASDELATNMIRAPEDDSVDYLIRALGVKVKQHPSGTNAGIFSKCVQYCVDTKAPYTVSNVHELAFDLHHGHTPQHPPSPDLSGCASPRQIPDEAEEIAEADMDAEGSEDDAPASPSPLTARKPRSVASPALKQLHGRDGEAEE